MTCKNDMHVLIFELLLLFHLIVGEKERSFAFRTSQIHSIASPDKVSPMADDVIELLLIGTESKSVGRQCLRRSVPQPTPTHLAE